MSRTRSGRSTEGSDRRTAFLDLAAAAAMGGAAYAWAPFAYPSGPVHAAVFLAAALLVIASRRIADHLWDATAGAPLVTGPPVLAALARYPFRLLGGGAAFTVAMLSAKRAEVLWVNDVPVINIFTAGAILAAVYNAVRDAVPGPRALPRPDRGTTKGHRR